MSETPTGTDRVELTKDEREQIIEAIYQGRVRGCREKVENWGPPEDEADTHSLLLRVLRGESEVFVANALPAVESIVAARVQALTAERDDLRQTVRANSDSANQRSMSISAELVKNAALQRLADESRAELAAANDRIAELTELFDGLRDDYQKACEEVERLQHHDWEDENAALQETLDRVTALADEWHRENVGSFMRGIVKDIRAALTPEADHV